MSKDVSKGKTQKSGFFNDFMDICETIIYSYFVIIMIFTFICSVARVDGPSMYPTLVDKDKLIYYHLFYEPKAEDIVIINSENLNKRIVKRVIATEGQTVDIDFQLGKVYVDGTELQENYINNLTTDNWGAFEYPITVPENCIFVMGDNRHVSLDSRDAQVGFVSDDDVMGKVVFRFYPTNSMGLLK